jgi:hypothetical protein
VIEFGAPWMLLGLLAAGVPVLLHLLGRQRARVVHFSALDFILAVNPKQARAMRVREWLLVALRSAVVAALAFALARPMLPTPWASSGPDAGNGPQAVVIVIDDSMSMSALDGTMPLLARAQSRAIQLVERLPAGSRVAVVASGFPARPLVRQLTADRGAVIDALRRVRAQPRRDDATRAWALAQALLEGDSLSPRRIVLFSDVQASGWQDAAAPQRTHSGDPIALQVDRQRPDSIENTAITDATVSADADSGGQLRVEVTLHHAGDKMFRDYVTLRAGDREVKSLMQLQPGETARRTFSLPAAAPWAEILLPADVLPADNRRMVRLDSSPALRVALVNGAPRPTPREDEVFFAARALEAASQRLGDCTVEVLPADKVQASSVAAADVIVLANVAPPSAESLAAVEAAVAAGKGLVVTLGDNLPDPPDSYLATLLPAPLSGLRSPTGESATARAAYGVRWSEPSVEASQAVVQLRTALRAAVGDALAQTQVQRYGLVRPDVTLAQHVVARYGDGAPALLIGSHGRGRVALLTTSMDRDWTDLPLQPGFVPLLQQLIAAVAAAAGTQRAGRPARGALRGGLRPARARSAGPGRGCSAWTVLAGP